MSFRICVAVCVLTALGLSRDVAQGEAEVALELDLPKPMFVGTPTPIKLPNLEPARKGARPDFMVPAGVKNLAFEKEVTSSDDFPVIGELEMVTDGDKEGSEGSYVELGPNLQYVQIDLGAPAKLHAIVLWHYHAQARAYKDVIVQVSDDPDFISGVETLFNNDHDNGASMGEGKDPAYVDKHEGRIVDAKDLSARYVRLYSNGNTANEMNHYIEVEVYGTEAE